MPYNCLYCAKSLSNSLARWCVIFGIYLWSQFLTHTYTLVQLCVHISEKRMMQSGIVQSQRPNITRAGSRCFPWPLTPTRQQHLMRHLIILKWLFPPGGAPCSSFYDEMSSTFAGQLLHQLHSEVKCFQQGPLWKKCANDVNFTLFTQEVHGVQWSKHKLYYSSVMQTITHLINQALYRLLETTELVTD